MDALTWNLSAYSVAVRLSQFATPVGLVVSEIAFEGECVEYDGGSKRLSIEKPAEFVAIIEESDLESFIKSKAPDSVEIHEITLVPGFIKAAASVTMIVSIRGEAHCVLDIEDEKRLFVRAQSVDVLGGSMLGTVQKQLDSLNPVIDVSELPLDVALKSVAIEQGRIVVSGSLLPKERSTE